MREKTFVRELSTLTVDIFDVSLGSLGEMIASPQAQLVVKAKCRQCGCELETIAINTPFVACDACIAKHRKDERTKRHREFWEGLCPASYRDTDIARADFPAAIWQEVKAEYDAKPDQSWFLYGPTGAAKTRLAMLLMKRALHRKDLNVQVIWPERLAGLTRTSFNEGESYFDRMAKVGMLLLDDALLTSCRESKLIDAVKMLIDARMRANLPTIITSQIGTEEDLAGGKEYGEAKPADLERIKALLRRIRETFRIVPFAKAEEGQGSF